MNGGEFGEKCYVKRKIKSELFLFEDEDMEFFSKHALLLFQ